MRNTENRLELQRKAKDMHGLTARIDLEREPAAKPRRGRRTWRPEIDERAKASSDTSRALGQVQDLPSGSVSVCEKKVRWVYPNLPLQRFNSWRIYPHYRAELEHLFFSSARANLNLDRISKTLTWARTNDIWTWSVSFIALLNIFIIIKFINPMSLTISKIDMQNRR